MIAEFKPYPAMKPSGVEWLGEVPEHWDVRRLWASVHGCINGIWGNDPNGREDLPCVRVADFDRVRLRVRLAKPTLRAIAPGERSRRLLKKSDLLLEKSGGGKLQPVGVVMLYDHDAEAVCSNFVARMPVSAHCDSSYLTYLHSHLYTIRLNVRSIKQTTGIQNLDSSSYLGEPVAFPPLPEQAAIVRFLDHADRRIQRYIRAKQKLVTLLEEQKQALIHQAVTGQIDVRTGQPYPAYKPSGVEWLGEVPVHWEVMRSRLLFNEVNVRSTTGKETHMSMSQTVGLVPSHMVERTLTSESYVGGKLCEKGDLVLNRLKAHLSIFALAKQSGVISPDYSVFRKRSSEEMVYFEQVFLLPALRSELRIRVKGIVEGFWRLYTDDLFDIRLPVPPVSEQKKIVDVLQGTSASIDTAINRARRQIELLQEYRTRLIADVVTGKLDVREAAAGLLEVDPLADEFDALTEAPETGVMERRCCTALAESEIRLWWWPRYVRA